MPIIYPAFRRSLPIVLFGLLCLVASPWISTGSSESTDPGTPVPTASPVGGPIVPNTIRQIALNAKDLVYDPVGQRIYASLPGSAPNGNSLVQIEPVAGTVGTPVFIGSEPGKLAISGNSQYIYASLEGAAAVRRFDIATQTPGLQFNLGSDSFFGPLYVEDMEVMPGQPTTVAVSRRYQGVSPKHAGVGIYDDGVVRPTTTPTHTGSNAIEFSSSASTLYGYNNESTEFGFRKMTVNGSGVTVTTTTQNLVSGFGVDIRYADGMIYSTSGKAVNPESGVAVGSFAGIGSGPLVLPDPSTNQIYFLAVNASSTVLRAFNLTTFIQTGSLTIPGVSGTLGSFIKWGTDGLAFRSGNQILLLSTTDIVPIPPTPAPSPVQVAPGVIQLALATNDLVYDSITQRVYASTPGSAGTFGNSLVPINPATGLTGTPVFIGSEPRKLAISKNNQYVYAGIDGANSVRRFILSSQTAELQFSLGNSQISSGPLSADDIATMPGAPNVVAIARRNTGFSPRHEGVAIYENGVPRPTTTARHTGSNVIDFGTYGAKLYGYNNETTDFGFRRMIVDGAGVSIVSSMATSITGFGTDIKFDNGNVYSSTGRAINAETGGSLGTFTGASSLAFVPDSTVRRVYFVTGSGSSTTLQAFDQTTFVPVGSLPIPGVSGTPNNLIRWGSDGLAFSTSGNQIYFIQTSLIPPAVMSASSTTISSSVNPSTFGQIVTFTATVSSASGTPSGSVQFQDKGVNLGSPQPLIGGSATLSSSSLTAGSHTITAEYSGDANFLKSGAALDGGQFVLPLVSVNDAQTSEGQSSTKTLSFTVSLSGATTQTVSVGFTTADGSATAGDYVATSGILTFNPGELTKTVNVTINGDPTVEPDETFFLNLSNPTNAVIGKAQGNGSILNDDGPVGSISFSQASYSVNENTGLIAITVNRTNDVSGSATVDYATSDTNAPASCATTGPFASSRCDFITALGTLRFAPGENQKTFNVLVNRDSYSESTESFSIVLSNLSGAIVPGSSSATVNILNNAVSSPPNNVIDDVITFGRQHYRDFLNRESDPEGLAFWTNQINACGSDAQCNEVRRIDVSASFFLSIEFQQTGYLVERFYKVAYGDANGISTFGVNHQLAVPIVRFNEFLKDTARIGQGVVVLQPNWEQLLESNKQAHALEFVQTSRFLTAFPVNMTPEQFVDGLNQNAGNVLSASERTTAINLFSGALNSGNNTARAQAVRQVAEDIDLYNTEYNRAFVLAQYFGYLRRNPNDAPDTDHTGYDFWLTKLNQFNGNYINAEMVKAFLSSIEYRQRFGP